MARASYFRTLSRRPSLGLRPPHVPLWGLTNRFGLERETTSVDALPSMANLPQTRTAPDSNSPAMPAGIELANATSAFRASETGEHVNAAPSTVVRLTRTKVSAATRSQDRRETQLRPTTPAASAPRGRSNFDKPSQSQRADRSARTESPRFATAELHPVVEARPEEGQRDARTQSETGKTEQDRNAHPSLEPPSATGFFERLDRTAASRTEVLAPFPPLQVIPPAIPNRSERTTANSVRIGNVDIHIAPPPSPAPRQVRQPATAATVVWPSYVSSFGLRQG